MALLPYKSVPENWDEFYAQQRELEYPDWLGAFYRQPLLDDKHTMQAASFVALDIETTGLNAQEDDIISIGLVPFNAERIYLAKAKHWVIRSRNLTSQSVVVHGITHSELDQAPSLTSVLPEVMQHLAGKQIVVHYRYMEREFFRSAIAELLQQNFLFPVIDTLEIEAKFVREKQSFLAKIAQKPLPSLRLPNVRERYHLPAYENHNALVDALATAELLQAQIAKQALTETWVRTLWC